MGETEIKRSPMSKQETADLEALVAEWRRNPQQHGDLKTYILNNMGKFPGRNPKTIQKKALDMVEEPGTETHLAQESSNDQSLTERLHHMYQELQGVRRDLLGARAQVAQLEERERNLAGQVKAILDELNQSVAS